MQNFRATPVEMVASLWHNRNLILQMSRREVIGRYRGSVMGLAWSFFNPLLMLSVYTFVFSVVFKMRWGGAPDDSRFGFAILLFVGMIVHGLFAECANRAPGLILGNANYVKKVVFPLEILPAIGLGSALFHAGISLVVLLAAQLLVAGSLVWTVLLFPLVLLPLIFTTIGFAWLFAGLGVYLRDMGQIVGVFTTALMFVSPVFFPASALPEQFQILMQLNPLTYIIEEGRNTLIFGNVPDAGAWLRNLFAGFVIAWLGFAWFQKVRKGFADVL